ncbi:MAG: GAF domain-containing sensor histidine kinase [Polyangiaceae bacterium]
MEEPSSASLSASADAKLRRLEDALQHERRVSTALREVGLALGATVDLDEVLELILNKITEALEADRATLYLLDESTNELVSRIVQGSEVKSIRLKMGDGIAGHVASTGQPLHVRDPYRDPRFKPEWDLSSGYRTRSVLAVPMKNHLGRTIGVVQVLNKHQGDFTTEDAMLLAALSTQASVSIDNSRLFLSVIQKNMQLIETKSQLENRVRDLKLLFSLESAMARAASLDELFMAVLGEAMRSCEAKAAAVALRQTAGVSLHVVDTKHKKMRRLPMDEGQGLIGHSMLHDEVVMMAAGEADTRADKQLDELIGFECESALAVPLEGEEGRSMGSIALYNKRASQSFSDEDRALLLLIAANASTAIRLQLAREEREREERLTTIGRLLSGVIHDLKTPLTLISGYVQLMDREKSDAKRDEYAKLILKQFDHISAMQRDVLEFARGERNVLIRKVYLVQFFNDVKDQLEPQLAKRGIEFALELKDKGTAKLDEGKILRVVHNLARNAEEAMAGRGGKFTIRVFREDDDLILQFSDTGPGIPKEIAPRLFQSFVTSGKKGGTGLGLAIVKKIAEEHNGTVEVQSSSRGATFTLRLPQTRG